MTKLLYAAPTVAILTVAGHLPAMAHSSTSGMSMPMTSCKDISTMDRDMSDCAGSPDRQLSEVIGMGMSGTGAGSTTP
jgi:hypothetical protein